MMTGYPPECATCGHPEQEHTSDGCTFCDSWEPDARCMGYDPEPEAPEDERRDR